MKIIRLKRGYRINMSDTEFDLYLRLINAGAFDMACDELPDPSDPVQRHFNRINGTEKMTAWYAPAEDRRDI